MKSVIFLLSTICFLLSFANDGYAFRCGNEPIGRWDTKEKVIQYCGSPSRTGSNSVKYNGKTVYAQTWYYNCGESDFVYVLSIYDGVVIKEETVGRGTGSSQCGK